MNGEHLKAVLAFSPFINWLYALLVLGPPSDDQQSQQLFDLIESTPNKANLEKYLMEQAYRWKDRPENKGTGMAERISSTKQEMAAPPKAPIPPENELK